MVEGLREAGFEPSRAGANGLRVGRLVRGEFLVEATGNRMVAHYRFDLRRSMAMQVALFIVMIVILELKFSTMELPINSSVGGIGSHIHHAVLFAVLLIGSVSALWRYLTTKERTRRLLHRAAERACYRLSSQRGPDRSVR